MTTPTTQREADERTTALIAAAEERAAAYDGDDRSGIKNDVINAFYAGSEWERRRARAAIDQSASPAPELRGSELAGIDLDKLTRYDYVPSEFGRMVIGQDDNGPYILRADVEALLSRQAAPEAPAAATDQPSAGQVDERMLLRDWEWALEKKGVHVSRGESSAFLEGVRKARASLTPTAPQAASQQAGACAHCKRPPGDPEGMCDWIECPVGSAPQAATTASASIDNDPEFQRLAEAWRAEPYGTRSFLIAWDALVAYIDLRAALARAPLPEIAPDPVVEANRQLLLDRSRVGVAKYGVTLAAAGLSRDHLMQHALEEALDLANYLQTLLLSAAPAQADDARDAARYRWLREQPFDTWKRIAWNTWNDEPPVFPIRDEAIDAAMSRTNTGGSKE